MHKISMKRIFKEPIFTAVEGKSPDCAKKNISVHDHDHLSEQAAEPAELSAMLKVI